MPPKKIFDLFLNIELDFKSVIITNTMETT